MKFKCCAHCGNSPKNQKLIDFTRATATQEHAVIRTMIAEDVVWNIVGQKILTGSDAFLKQLSDMMDVPISVLELMHVLTHGKTGAVNGSITFKNGSRFEFSEIYLFTSAGKQAKIKEIHSYILPVNQ